MKMTVSKGIAGFVALVIILMLFSSIKSCINKKDYTFKKQFTLTNGTRITVEWNDEGTVQEK